MSPYGSYVLETVLTLVLVSLVAFVLLYGARRLGMGRGGTTAGLELVGRVPIDARRSVVLVRVAERVFVVGVSEAGLSKIGEMSAAELPPRAGSTSLAFGDALKGVLGGRAKVTNEEKRV